MLYKTGKSGKSKWETKEFPLNDISDYYQYQYLFQMRGKQIYFCQKTY